MAWHGPPKPARRGAGCPWPLFALGVPVAPTWCTAALADPVEQGLATAGKATDRILADNGTIGAVLILVALASVVLHALQGYAIASLYKANQTLQEKRATDAAESTKQVASTAISGSAAITASNERLADTAARMQTLAERVLLMPDAIVEIKNRLNEIARSCSRGTP